MTYRNAQAKNIGNDEGDVYKFFQMKLSNLVQKNGGNHSFNWKTLLKFLFQLPNAIYFV